MIFKTPLRWPIAFEVTESLLNFCRTWEGLYLTAYDDGTGVWTIGYGHINGVKRGDTCTQEQADQWLLEELEEAAVEVRQYVKVKITQGMFDALCSFVMNLGGRNLARSTLLAKLNREDYDGAAAEFPKWNLAGGHVMRGLTARRRDEQDRFKN
jgi:lysozyme